jgi:hypothetical protein
MKPPPRLLEDTDLLAYAEVPPSARFTGRLHLYDGVNVSGRFRSWRFASRTMSPACSWCIVTNRGASWGCRLGTGRVSSPS